MTPSLSFGVDGQPSSYSDIDECDVLFLVGHNPAATGTVLWARMLDRMAHEDPPKLVVMDPRVTAVAERANVHLQPKVGTNLAVLNGLQNILIKKGWYDQAYIDKVRETVASDFAPEPSPQSTIAHLPCVPVFAECM